MKKKTDVVSIRVNEFVKDRLVEECYSKNITLNALINQIISKYVESNSLLDGPSFLFIEKAFLKELLEQVSDPALKEMSSNVGKELFKDATIYLHGKYDMESIIMNIESWCSMLNIPFKKIEKTEYNRFVIHHELGKKFTMYFESLMKLVFSDLNIELKNIIKTRHSLSFQLQK